MSSLADHGPVVVVGGGQAGALMTLFLARQGVDVQVFESRPDLRETEIHAGRSINLALATRGIVPLTELGLYESLEPIMVPMTGRMVHPETDPEGGAGQPVESSLQPYGLTDAERIFAISRRDLNQVMLDAAEVTGRVRITFDRVCRRVDLERKVLTFSPYGDPADEHEVAYGTLFGCDGANSVVRAAIQEANGGSSTEDVLDHGYKELSIPAGPGGRHLIEPNALHIWPRNDFMLIALANPAGDFTVTLFMPMRGPVDSFESFADPDGTANPGSEVEDRIMAFFEREFPDFVPLVPDLASQFVENPTGDLSTIRNTGWSIGADAVVVGDAAHAIVPFHGQGMNLGLESCRLLDRLMREHPDDLELAFTKYEADRKPDADAIAEMALENYVEMRSGVVDPAYLLKRELALEMERRHPDKIAARYGMVMFTTMRYAEVRKRAERQNELFARLTAGASTIDDVDFDMADELVARLGPLPLPI